MLVKTVALLCVIFFGFASTVQADVGAENASVELARKLDKVDYVALYFLSRTEKFSLSEDVLKEEAGIIVRRRCGSNCRMFLKNVIVHLAHSKPTRCLDGQQDALIEIGNSRSLLYSYSGRMIKFDGMCFYNETKIDQIIKNRDFLFD